MSWSAIRDQITTTLRGVAGIGQVYDYLRHIRDVPTRQSVLESNNLVNAWMHTRVSMDSQLLTNKEVRKVHTWRVLGYYGLNDAQATERTFQQLLEDIEAAFRGDVTLAGTAEFVDAIDIVDPVGHVLIPPGTGGVLCHHAEMRLTVQERVA